MGVDAAGDGVAVDELDGDVAVTTEIITAARSAAGSSGVGGEAIKFQKF